MRKCAKKGCAKLVPDEYEKKTCLPCLEKQRIRSKKYNATAKGKATAKMLSAKSIASGYEQSDARKDAKKKRYREPKAFAKRATDDFRIRKNKACRKCRASTNGVKRRESTMSKITVKLCELLSGKRMTDPLVSEYCGFNSRSEVTVHFEATMNKTWMTWQNRGRHVHSSPLKTAWQIGHKIPKAVYDATNDDDMHRCWHPTNLFAQDAAENASNQTDLPATNVLLQMRSVWPASWQGCLPVSN